jgi:NADPH:quinone reductase-like Zn-dependent oxidoreductase
MKAARIQRFGPVSVITIDDLPRNEPDAGELLVRVKAAGVGHWDALIREGKVQGEPLPLILGSELSGIVEAIGAGVSGFKTGDEVFGATNEHFTGSLQVLKPGGILVSVVSLVPESALKRYGVRAAYFYVDVTTERLNKIAELFDSGKLVTDVGTVLPLADARIAHEMLGGAPHKRGKIVLNIAA